MGSRTTLGLLGTLKDSVLPSVKVIDNNAYLLPYFAVYNVYFFAHVFEGNIRMDTIHGQCLKYLVPVLVFCNYLLPKISCIIVCSKINA